FQTEFFSGVENQQYNQIEEWILVVIAAFSSVLIALLLWTASMIFKDLAAEFMPFSDLTVNRLRRIAGILLVYSLAPQIMYS
ncbi:hypothetical protein EON13_15820, partial [Listeria monocytogenes]|nr:hypothetical protein [Listeria monocytogenes]